MRSPNKLKKPIKAHQNSFCKNKKQDDDKQAVFTFTVITEHRNPNELVCPAFFLAFIITLL